MFAAAAYCSHYYSTATSRDETGVEVDGTAERRDSANPIAAIVAVMGVEVA